MQLAFGQLAAWFGDPVANPPPAPYESRTLTLVAWLLPESMLDLCELPYLVRDLDWATQASQAGEAVVMGMQVCIFACKKDLTP
jgi:hypothetical protein